MLLFRYVDVVVAIVVLVLCFGQAVSPHLAPSTPLLNIHSYSPS